MQIIERRRAILGGPRTPCRDNIGAREPVLGPPRGVHRGHRRQRCEIERIVATRRHQHRSEEHTSELQSLMRISYAVFCLKKKKTLAQHYSATLSQEHTT